MNYPHSIPAPTLPSISRLTRRHRRLALRAAWPARRHRRPAGDDRRPASDGRVSPTASGTSRGIALLIGR